MPSDRVILAVGITVFGLSLAVVHVWREVRRYRAHRDPRGLRSFVSALTILFFSFAIIGRSPTMREEFQADWPILFVLLTTSGLTAGLCGLLFLASDGKLPWRRRP